MKISPFEKRSHGYSALYLRSDGLVDLQFTKSYSPELVSEIPIYIPARA